MPGAAVRRAKLGQAERLVVAPKKAPRFEVRGGDNGYNGPRILSIQNQVEQEASDGSEIMFLVAYPALAPILAAAP